MIIINNNHPSTKNIKYQRTFLNKQGKDFHQKDQNETAPEISNASTYHFVKFGASLNVQNVVKKVVPTRENLVHGMAGHGIALVTGVVCLDKIEDKEKKSMNRFEVTSQAVSDFHSNFMEGKYDDVLKSFDFSELWQGVPLEYSRTDFLKKLEMFAKNDPSVFEKLSIKPLYNGSYLKGFDGIIKPINDNSELSDEVNKFLFQNKVQTENAQLNTALNEIIAFMPEFISIIGRKQHHAHDYTVDIHTLIALQKAMKSKEYGSLNDKQKKLLKFSILVHDFAKKTEIVDREHPKNGLIYAQEILSKTNFDENFQKRIINMVNHHHWYQEYDYDNPHETACKFRYPGDFEVAAIMTAADIKAVGEGFGEMYLQRLPCVCNDVLRELDEFYATGNFSLGDQINLNSVGFEKKVVNGIEYKVLDLYDADETTIENVFGKGVSCKSLALLVHGTDTPTDMAELLYSSDKTPFISVSLIEPCNPRKTKTFWDRKSGFVLSANHIDVANIAKFNISSGCKKNFNDYCEHTAAAYPFRKTSFIAFQTQFKDKNLTPEIFGELYKTLLSYDNFYSLPDAIKIRDIEFKKDEILEALKKLKDEIITANHNNEQNILKPSIQAIFVKGSFFDGEKSNIDKEYLEIAYKKGLPIIIIQKEENDGKSDAQRRFLSLFAFDDNIS